MITLDGWMIYFYYAISYWYLLFLPRKNLILIDISSLILITFSWLNTIFSEKNFWLLKTINVWSILTWYQFSWISLMTFFYLFQTFSHTLRDFAIHLRAIQTLRKSLDCYKVLIGTRRGKMPALLYFWIHP